jgi:ABC-type sugar transport system permease subunit
MSALRRQQQRFAFRCLLPTLLLFTFWVTLPAVKGFYYATTHWDGLSDPVYVGLDNFREMKAALLNPAAGASAKLFPLAIRNNLILMFFPMILILGLSLFLASSLRGKVRGASLFRVAYFFPNILSSVAISVLWMLLYSTSGFGVFNYLLTVLNETLLAWNLCDPPLVKVPFAFTDSKILAWALIPMIVWAAAGFYTILFLAAMQSIPESLYESARVDGATKYHQFRHITLPMIRDTIVTGMVFLLLGGLKIFDPIWVIEQQQARPDSNTLATLMYSKIFSEYQVGYGTAISVVLFLVVLTFTLLTIRLYRKEALEY